MIVQALVGISLIVAFIGYDVYLAFDHIKGNTWSEIAMRFGRVNLVVPYVWAWLAGHFWFLNGWKSPFDSTSGFIVLLWSTAAVAVLSTALHHIGLEPPAWVALVPGFLVGMICWPA